MQWIEIIRMIGRVTGVMLMAGRVWFMVLMVLNMTVLRALDREKVQEWFERHKALQITFASSAVFGFIAFMAGIPYMG